jgi:hypothetical protein
MLGTAGCVPAPLPSATAADMPEVGATLSISLRPSKTEDEFVARFTNVSQDVVRILKPLDGSEHSWLMPHYAYSVADGKGTKFKLFGRCGHYGQPYSDTKWPDDYLVELRPGETHDETVWFPVYIPDDGEYAVSLEYKFTPKPDEKLLSGDKYPAELWHGAVKSKPLRVKLKGQKELVEGGE